MNWFFALGVSLELFLSFVAGLDLRAPFAASRDGTNISWDQTQTDLAALICQNSTFVSPQDADYANATERFFSNVRPDIQLLVRPGCESDVKKIVKYAFDRNIPYYPVNRGHAFTSSVSKFNGLEIDLRNLNFTHVRANGKTALFGGAARSHEVIESLYAQGYLTASGGCGCVSLIGPALGGGHGMQQGQHGLTGDQFVNLNLVLPNGTAISVNATSHPDLWWAMRGAGHNFGIVTSFESKIWPNPRKLYFVRTYQFPGSSHDAVFKQINKFQGNGTLSSNWLAGFGTYAVNPTFSKTEATISWTFLYGGGSTDVAKADLRPFDQLNPLSIEDVNLPYNLIFNTIGGAVDGPGCEGNMTHIVGTRYFQVYNVTAQRQIFNLFNDKLRQQPRLTTASILYEGYSTIAVRNIPSQDTAYPSRDMNLLTAFDIVFEDRNDPLISFAEQWRKETLALWDAGQSYLKPKVYVNYAAGFESLESRYGYEPWRLDRLRKLKSEYDPLNKFAWYNPVIPPQ